MFWRFLFSYKLSLSLAPAAILHRVRLHRSFTAWRHDEDNSEFTHTYIAYSLWQWLTETDAVVEAKLHREMNKKENDNHMNNNGNSSYRSTGGNTLRVVLVALLALAVAGIASAQTISEHGPVIAAFKGGIGVNPVTGFNADGTARLNVVRGVNPAGPWRIADLQAVVSADGHISVIGRGLLLAAGEGIGTNARASVHATLFCGSANSSATSFDSPAVALQPNGDFSIDTFLTRATPSISCENPALLIRVGQPGGGVWFAAGIPLQVGTTL
jgi:hypothetical protein